MYTYRLCLIRYLTHVITYLGLGHLPKLLDNSSDIIIIFINQSCPELITKNITVNLSTEIEKYILVKLYDV